MMDATHYPPAENSHSEGCLTRQTNLSLRPARPFGSAGRAYDFRHAAPKGQAGEYGEVVGGGYPCRIWAAKALPVAWPGHAPLDGVF